MRTLLAMILCSFLVSLSVNAQTVAKMELRILNCKGDHPSLGMNALVEHQLGGQVKTWAWLQTEEKWAEAYIGLAYSPTTWFEVGLAAGIEQASQPWRIGGYVWLGDKFVSFLALAEDGGTGKWYQVTLLAKPVPWFEFGGMSKRFVGLGPRLDFSFPSDPKFKLWIAHLIYDPEFYSVDPKRFLLGLSYSF